MFLRLKKLDKFSDCQQQLDRSTRESIVNNLSSTVRQTYPSIHNYCLNFLEYLSRLGTSPLIVLNQTPRNK